MNHSSDIKTFEEIFELPFLNNPIPLTETNVAGAFYNNVATVNDLSDLFVDGAIPAAPTFSVTPSPLVRAGGSGNYLQLVRIENTGTSPASAPLWLVLDNLSANATLVDAAGSTAALAPLGSPYVSVKVPTRAGLLRPHESVAVSLRFDDPSGEPIDYDTRVLSVTPAP
jgi:hypothetical protein